MKSATIKRTLILFVLLFIAMNVVAALHAYRFTHFSLTQTEKTAKPENLTTSQKLTLLFTGVKTPKPTISNYPERPYTELQLSSDPAISAWHIPVENSLGTVALFHGYIGDKSKMVDKAEVLNQLGYSTLLVDFMGSGDSEGVQTTIGYYEAAQVIDAFNYLNSAGESTIYLFGTSMGSVAIMKAMEESDINPTAVLLECPFGTLYETVCARFNSMGLPCFPMGGLLVFWGGIQNGYWGFSHNPEDYASSVTAPALLMYGAKDARVSRAETDAIFTRLPEEKELVIFPEAGHENYLIKYADEWKAAVSDFLGSNNAKTVAGVRHEIKHDIEFLSRDSLFLNGKIKYRDEPVFVRNTIGSPGSVSIPSYECGGYVAGEEPWGDKIRAWHYGSTQFVEFKDVIEITEVDFREREFFVKFPAITLNKQTSIDDIKRLFPVAASNAFEFDRGDGSFEAIQLHVGPKGSDDQWLLLFQDDTLVKLMYYIPC